MITTDNKHAVEVFTNRKAAEQSVNELKASSFPMEKTIAITIVFSWTLIVASAFGLGQWALRPLVCRPLPHPQSLLPQPLDTPLFILFFLSFPPTYHLSPIT